MEFSEQQRQLYSNSNLTKLNNSNSTVNTTTVFRNLADVIPDDDYTPFYAKKLRTLGEKRFFELANKARKSGRSPQHLFFWMLQNNELVK